MQGSNQEPKMPGAEAGLTRGSLVVGHWCEPLSEVRKFFKKNIRKKLQILKEREFL